MRALLSVVGFLSSAVSYFLATPGANAIAAAADGPSVEKRFHPDDFIIRATQWHAPRQAVIRTLDIKENGQMVESDDKVWRAWWHRSENPAFYNVHFYVVAVNSGLLPHGVHQARLFFNKYARSISGASRILNAEMAVTPGGVTWRIAERNWQLMAAERDANNPVVSVAWYFEPRYFSTDDEQWVRLDGGSR